MEKASKHNVDFDWGTVELLEFPIRTHGRDIGSGRLPSILHEQGVFTMHDVIEICEVHN